MRCTHIERGYLYIRQQLRGKRYSIPQHATLFLPTRLLQRVNAASRRGAISRYRSSSNLYRHGKRGLIRLFALRILLLSLKRHSLFLDASMIPSFYFYVYFYFSTTIIKIQLSFYGNFYEVCSSGGFAHTVSDEEGSVEGKGGSASQG